MLRSAKKSLDTPEARKQREAEFAATEKRRDDVISARQQNLPPPAQHVKQQNFNNRQYPTHFYANGGRLAEK